MDNVKFVRYTQRYCRAHFCSTCPIYDICDLDDPTQDEAKRYVDAITEWAKEHPFITRQSEFLKLHPNACIDDDGVLNIMPCDIDFKANVKDENGDCRREYCFDCRRGYWMEEVE